MWLIYAFIQQTSLMPGAGKTACTTASLLSGGLEAPRKTGIESSQSQLHNVLPEELLKNAHTSSLEIGFPWTEVGLRYQYVFKASQVGVLFTILLLFQVQSRKAISLTWH